MRISMKLEMKDRPGQLVAALQPVSELGGNIIAVIHQRDPFSGSDTLSVQIVLEMPEGRLDDLLDAISRVGVSVARINEERLHHTRHCIVIGHLMHTDLGDTVDQIDRTGFAEVTELSMVMPAIDQPSSARITIQSVTSQDMEKALDILRTVAARKGLLIVEPLEEQT